MVLWAVWDEDDYWVKVVIIHNHKTEEKVDLPLDILLEHDGWMWNALEDALDRDFLKESGSWSWRGCWYSEIPELFDNDWAACTEAQTPGQGPYIDWEYNDFLYSE